MNAWGILGCFCSTEGSKTTTLLPQWLLPLSRSKVAGEGRREVRRESMEEKKDENGVQVGAICNGST